MKDTLKKTLKEVYPGFGQNREASSPAQGSSNANPTVEQLPAGGGSKTPLDNAAAASLAPNGSPGDRKAPKQGDSKDATVEDIGSEDVGLKVGAKAGGDASAKASVKAGRDKGKSDIVKDVADGTSVINMPKGRGNLHQESADEDFITQEEFDALSDEEKDDYVKIDEVDAEVDEIVVIPEFDVDKVFESEDSETLTEEFKSKFKSLVEAHIEARVAAERIQIRKELTEAASETIAKNLEDVAEVVGNFVEETAIKWLDDNQVAVVSEIRNHNITTFMTGIKTLLEQNYVEIPEDRQTLIDELQQEVETLRAQVEESESIAEQAVAELHIKERGEIIAEVSTTLSLAQAEKFSVLVENVKFENADSFRTKIESVRNTFYGPSKKDPATDIITESVHPQEITSTRTDVLGAVAALRSVSNPAR